MREQKLSATLLLFHSCRIRDAVSLLSVATDVTTDPFSFEAEEDVHLLLRGLFELDRIDQLKSRVDSLKDRSLLNPERGTAQTLINLGSGYVYLGKMHEASNAYSLAYDKLKAGGEGETQVRALLGWFNADRAINGATFALERLKASGLEDRQNISAQNKMAIGLFKANLLSEIGDDVTALNEFWKCYDRFSESKSLFQYYYLLYYLYEAHVKIGEVRQARTYLDLLKRAIDREEMCRMYKMIASEKDLLFSEQKEMVFLKSEGRIQLPDGRWIDLGRQNILRSLFEILSSKNGKPVDIEKLVHVLWNESYSPQIHDNKIYVTIRRLRQILEPEAPRPRLINKDRYGYFLTIPVRQVTMPMEATL